MSPRPLVALFVLGCASVGVKTEPGVDLRRETVVALSAAIDGPSGACVGIPAPLVVTATLADGRVVSTKSTGAARLAWDGLVFGGRAVSVENGRARLDPRPDLTRDTPATLEVRIEGARALASVEIPARYDCPFVADFSGAAGADGQDGADGRDAPFTSSSVGYSGWDGTGGGDGGRGRDGEPLVVTVAMASREPALLEVVVRGLTTGRTSTYIVDPSAGSLRILASGGAGGRGGRGGNGGTGGVGSSAVGAFPLASADANGPGGDGARGGHGGDGGAGGAITVHAHGIAPELLRALSFENRGGAAGLAGRPGRGGSGGMGARAGEDGPASNVVGSGGDLGIEGGRDGRHGEDGPPPTFVTAAAN